MAYSNDKVWAWTTTDIVNRALRILGEYDEGDAPTTGESETARVVLNSMIREWTVTDGIGLWLRKRCILILNPGKWRYKLGPAGTPGTDDDFHAFLDTELIEGINDAVELAPETNISVANGWFDYAGNDSAPPANADVVGVELDNGEFHWTTTVIAQTTGITLAAGIPAGRTTRAGGRVYTYTTRMPRPHGILEIVRESNSGSAATVNLIGRREYEQQSQKGATGVPVSAHFDPGLDSTTQANNYSTLHVWPTSNGTDWWKLVFVGEFYPDIVDQTDAITADDIQFPDEWAGALAYNLADELADEYEIDLRRAMRIASIAEKKYSNLAWAADRENASFHMAISRSGR